MIYVEGNVIGAHFQGYLRNFINIKHFLFQLMIDGMKPLPSWGPASRTKQQQYADVEINIKECESNPAFARLMGSSISTTTTVTDYSPASSTLNLIKSRSESNV